MSKLPSSKLHKTFNQRFTKIISFGAVFFLAATQYAHAQASGLVPCDGTDCSINSVIQLINNIINFFFHVLLVPLFVVMIVYLGWGYLTSGGNPGQHAKLKSMAKHMFLGLLLMLTAFVIVKVILSIVGYKDTLGFFAK